VPRYYFDIYDGIFRLDEDGVECVDFDEVRREAKRTLPEIARDFLPEDGDHHAITCRVRDERNETVYTATLIFHGFSTRVEDLCTRAGER
jgi:hypothetical protein